MTAGRPDPGAIRRRFLRVGRRRVHYLRAGAGPPVVLVHSSPANAWLLRAEIEHLSPDYTVFAFDTPGFGLSDALPGETLEVADLADALAETLEAIGMPRCPMFGTHTGAAIALEFGVRHPGRLTGLVLDGVPAFNEEERRTLFGDYFRPMPVSDLGAQYASAWTRFRDQSIWFPWSDRRPERLNAYDLGPAHSTHLWVSMYFEAAHKYVPAYRAASYYGHRAIVAAKALALPAIYTATETDMLFPHLERLPPMKPGQEIRSIGKSYALKRELISEGFQRFGSPGAPPPDRDAIESSPEVERQFLTRAGGGELHLRHAGDRAAPALLILHDAPGSAAGLQPLIQALARERFVLAPDLPGSGESEPFPTESPSIRDFAASALEVIDRLGLGAVEVMGIGFGASVAADLATLAPERVTRLLLEGLLLPDAEERRSLKASYAPPIAIEPDGAHWYRTWLMLRDSQVWWPWFERREANQRGAAGDFSAETLHAWTLEVMRARASYGQVIAAALDHDAAAAVSALRIPIGRLTGGSSVLSVYDAALAALVPGAAPIAADGEVAARADRILALGRME